MLIKKLFEVNWIHLQLKWAELDLNQRSITQRIYNPPPLTTRAPTPCIILTNLIKKNNLKIIK